MSSRFLKTILPVVAVVFLVAGYLYWMKGTGQIKNKEARIETENVFCRKDYTAEVFKIDNIDVVKRIIEIWKEKGDECEFNIAGENIGVAKKISSDGEIYHIVFYDKDDKEQSMKPFDQSVEQFEINLNNNMVSYQLQLDGSFFEIGKFKEEIKTADWKTYRNEEYGFEVEYPTNIFQLDKNISTLSHTLKNFHKYSMKDGSDLGLARDIAIIFKKENEKGCNWLETELGLKSLGVAFEFKNIKGVKYETGAEGEGIIYYCVKNKDNQNIFLIERLFLNTSYSTELPKQNDHINNEQQENIFNQILSTFKFTE